jgi:hypothetical protein
MEIHLIAQGKTDPPRLITIKRPVVDLTDNQVMTFCVIEGGMASGEPSVIIVSQDDEESICLQTSLDKFLSAGSGLAAMAENWGWTRPEGYLTIMPPDKETRKVLLEGIKKELEEWSE